MYAIELPCLDGFGGSRELLLTAGGMPGLDWAGPLRRGPKLLVNEQPLVTSTTSGVQTVVKRTTKKTVRCHKRKLAQLGKEPGTKRLLDKGKARRDRKRQSRELQKGSPVNATPIDHGDVVLVRRKSQRTTRRANFAALGLSFCLLPVFFFFADVPLL